MLFRSGLFPAAISSKCDLDSRDARAGTSAHGIVCGRSLHEGAALADGNPPRSRHLAIAHGEEEQEQAGDAVERPFAQLLLHRLGEEVVHLEDRAQRRLEVIQARALGLEVAGFSCLTNFAAGISAGELSHDKVLEIGKSAAAEFGKLLRAAF